MCESGFSYETTACAGTQNRVCSGCTACVAGSSYVTSVCTIRQNRVCTACTTCAAGSSYETSACTILLDRVCTGCTTCVAGSNYETTACAGTQNRVCTGCTTCVAGSNYETTACAGTQNRVCTGCTTCAVGVKYESRACTVTQNRVCTTFTACVSSVSYETRIATTTQDRQCTACRAACNPVGEFQVSACNTTQNRVCQSCSAQCASGYRIASACNQTQNLKCERCVCPAGTYLPPGVCTGTTSTAFDAARDCVKCYTVADLEQGRQYLSGNCTGSERASNIKLTCYSMWCAAGSYAGGCNGFTLPTCVPYTTCGTSQYLSGAGQANDGVCTACRNCTASGLRVVRACGALLNAACGGDACNSTRACVSTNSSARYCEYAENVGLPTCGVCPDGYGSDGQFCMECPEGKTCTRRGLVSCDGVCGPRTRSQCDGGYAKCDEGACAVTGNLTGATVTRGTYENPLDGDCATYVLCKVGYYKLYVPTGSTPQCLPCTAPNSIGSRFVSSGLSVNDAGSCLWECDTSRQIIETVWLSENWQCFTSGNLPALAKHEAGWYGIPGSRDYPLATCASGYTTEASTTLRASDCKACPSLPVNAMSVAGARNCEWMCKDGWYQRGERCVRMGSPGWVCQDAGTTTSESGECVSSSVPWNRAGKGKTALGVTARVLPSGRNQTLAANGTLAASSAVGGVSGRHTVTRGWGQAAAVIAGPLCSYTTIWAGKYEYLVGAVCNQSFLVFLNLSAVPARQRLEVLIGQPGSPGWADGFKTQARFERELYVTSGLRNGTVWVLDRWNCVVREVILWPTPGDYRTRVYTVHGATEKFVGMAVPEAKCYGAGSLASPRRFWALDKGSGVVLFSDDNGLWQLELATGELRMAMREGWDPEMHLEADEVRAATSVSMFELVLEFFSGVVWSVTASEAACADGTTSNSGGDCVVGCAWLAGGGAGSYYVDTSDGSCVACAGDLGCKEGQEFVGCTRAGQGWCRNCTMPAEADGRVFAVQGRCDAYLMVYVPPCPAGYYAGVGGRYCERCPSELATTRYPNATRVEQCKCKAGLSRSKESRECVGDALYVYGGVCAGVGGCSGPPHATLGTAEWQRRRCQWECDAGYYHDTTAGEWASKCKACTLMAGKTAVTRGDDDSPLSCEFA